MERRFSISNKESYGSENDSRTKSKTKMLIWLLAEAAVIVGMVSYYFWTNRKTPVFCKCPTVKRGVITGIIYAREKPSAIIGGKIVYEGDKIQDAKIVRIYKDKVEFEKNGQRWTQQLKKQPSQL